MACITPGSQKHKVNKRFNIKAPMRPVVNTATGGNTMQRK